MDYVKVTLDKLNVEEISDLVASPNCGAISIFVGTTRDNFEGKSVVKLEYEVYESMAIKSMKDICAELRKKWVDLENIAIYHRHGTVPIKEASVIIAISSPHRADAMAATQLCIEDVKKSVPIWKKEVYKDCVPEWKENKESTTYPPRICLFKLEQKPEVQASFIPPHLIQVKIDRNEIEQRIQKFMERKRHEVDESNVRDFCARENRVAEKNSSCARVDAKFSKRKDSKSHLQVNRMCNKYYRDHRNLKYMNKYRQKNGIEERMRNVEMQVGFRFTIEKDVYARMKSIEDRLLHLESISPEYMQFFGRNMFHLHPSSKKRIFSVSEIDSMISQLECKKAKSCHASSDEDNRS